MSIGAARIQLVSAQPLYGAVLQNCLFSWNDAVKTAGVGVDNKGRVNLIVAPTFWDKLSEEHRVGLLMHEMLHLLMEHNVGAKRDQGMDHKLANIAEDIAINQFIPADLLPPGALLPAKYGFKTGLAFEEYYLLLLQNQDDQKDKGETLDNHEFEFGDGSGDGESMSADSESKGASQKSASQPGDSKEDSQGTASSASSLSKEIQSAVIRDLINKAVQSVGAGNVPKHVKSMLPDPESQQAKVRWSNFLRKYMGRYLSNEVRSTRNKPNRRLGFNAQGSIRDDAPKCMFGFDESGSMSDADLQDVTAEAKNILKALSDKTEVVHFDTQIAHIEKLSKIKSITRHAKGGTDFTPLVEHANSRGIDLLVILSDGDGPMRVQPKMPVIWILPEKCQIKHKGEKIYLKG